MKNFGKKYIWLKLRDDFFTAPKIKKLRKIAGGDTYTVIYLKMMLLSIRTDGVIEYQGIEKGLADELALVLDEEESNVNITLLYLEKMGLIETLCESSYLLPSVPPLIGSEGDSAERMRKLRSNKKDLLSQCDTHVTIGDKKVTTEKELEIEIERDEEEDRGVVSFLNIPSSLSKITESQIRSAVKIMLTRKKPVDSVGYENHLFTKIEEGDYRTCQNVLKILSGLEVVSEAPWVRDNRLKRERGESLQLEMERFGFNNPGEAYASLKKGAEDVF